jgi:hypothetical protein
MSDSIEVAPFAALKLDVSPSEEEGCDGDRGGGVAAEDGEAFPG